MDFEALPPTEGLEKLKCSSCSKCLSYFPVYITEDKEIICGRCITSPICKSYIRNEAFEALAQYVDFPCCYKNEGCFHKAPPKDIPNHELTCSFRVVTCPTSEFTRCLWTGSKPTVLHHCQDEHFELFFKNGEFQFDLTMSQETTNLLENDSVLFIVLQKFNPFDNFLEISIFHIECDSNLDQLSCEVNFSTDNRHLSAKCSTTYFADRKITEIFLNSLKECKDLNGPVVVSGKISLQKSDAVNTSVIKARINEDLLAQLKCSICQCYALPPIYQYSKDGALENAIRCSNCSGASGTNALRNFSLDNLANLLNYPCENEKNGCKFIGKPAEMVKHRSFCPQKNFTCPVSEFVQCIWTGLYKDLYIHIQDAHSDMLMERSTEITVKIGQTQELASSTSNIGVSGHSLFSMPKDLSSASNISVNNSSIFAPNSEKRDGHQLWTTPIQPTKFGDLLTASTVKTSAPSRGIITFPCKKNSYPANTGFSFAVPTTATTTNPSFNFSSSTTAELQPINFNPPKTTQNSMKCYITKFSNRLFRVNYVETEQLFVWCVQTIGPFQEQFIYELEIVDKKDNRKALIVRQACSLLKPKELIQTSSDSYFHKKQLLGFISNDEITFKVNVFK